MKKVNYKIDKDNYIISYSITPFDNTKPYIEVENISEIVIGKTRVINGSLNNDGEGNSLYKRREKLENQKVYRKELQAIKAWFSANDWKVNKVVIGEWETTDQRWLDYLKEREIKRARQDELIELLK